MNVTLRPSDDNAGEGKAYDVLVDGERVGHIYQGMVTHDRKPRGSRIVTRRTRSLRWFAVPGSGWGWMDTRYEAVAVVLSAKLGESPASHHDTARAATVERA